MATATAPPVTPKTSTSVDPLYTQALAQAKTALAAETAPIAAEQKASDAHFQQRQTDATGVAAALSKLLEPIGPAVNNIYQTASQNQELAANGFSQGMQDALKGNTDNLNAMLKSLGQNVTLDSHATQAGDVLYGLGGYNPGTAFAKEGAAFGSAATLQSGNALLKGQENVKSLKAQAIVADQGFEAKIAEMAGKLPGDVQDNYTKLQQLSLENARFREQLNNDKFDQAYKTASLKLQGAKYKSDVAYKSAQLQMSQERYNLSVSRAQWQQSNADRAYGLSYAKYLQAEQSAAAKAKRGGLSEGAWNTLQGKAQDFTKGLYQGVPGHVTYPNASNGLTQPRIDSWKQKPAQYQQAIKTLIQRYPALGASGAIRLANSMYQPGEGGRPAFTPQQEAALGAVFPNTAPNRVGVGTNPGNVVEAASRFLGVPYQWGGTSTKGMDCSAFLQASYHAVGVNIPRTTYAQFKVGAPVALPNLQPGDAIFTEPGKNGPNHVGLYIGNGQVQESPHTGDVNKIIPLQSFLTGGLAGIRRYGG